MDCKQETAQVDRSNSEEQKKKIEHILALENSGSFSNTHRVIRQLRQDNNWNDEEINLLCQIALSNGQVRYILTDLDVATFFRSILKLTKDKTPNTIEVQTILDSEQ